MKKYFEDDKLSSLNEIDAYNSNIYKKKKKGGGGIKTCVVLDQK